MRDLRDYTIARVGLGSAGDSLPTAPLLAMRLAHARARDAVQLPLDTAQMQADMKARGWPSIVLRSKAHDREEYLRRPDLGRKLAPDSAATLGELPPLERTVFVVCDGLSALAVERHAIPLLHLVFARLPHKPSEAQRVILVNQGRVAIGDAIGELLGAAALVLLIGERPGLSSPDSLGVYLTWQPHTRRNDAERNCISNIHEAGLSYESAARKLVFLLREMRRLNFSGVRLKDTSSEQINLPPIEK